LLLARRPVIFWRTREKGDAADASQCRGSHRFLLAELTQNERMVELRIVELEVLPGIFFRLLTIRNVASDFRESPQVPRFVSQGTDDDVGPEM